MKTAMFAGLFVLLSLAGACGGKVVTEGNGGAGRGGSSSGDGGGDQGGGGPCGEADCSGDGSSCSCVTTCPGTKLRADCAYSGDTLICECHKDMTYVGTCGQTGGPVCDLPGGCCEDYL